MVTGIIIGCLVLLIISVDLLLWATGEDTISRWFKKSSNKNWVPVAVGLAFAAGYICGHMTFPT